MKHLKAIIEHAIDGLNNKTIFDLDKQDLHHALFNEDYFIVGYHQADEWLKENEIGGFEAIQYVMEQDKEMFGEVNLNAEDCNSEKIVNLYAYYKGQELINGLQEFEDCQDELTEDCIIKLTTELENLLNS